MINCVPRPLLIIVPHHETIYRQMVWPNVFFKWLNMVRANMAYFVTIIVIGILFFYKKTMDYRLNKQTYSILYSLYKLLYGREPMLSSYVREKLNAMIDLNGLEVWVQYLHERAKCFICIMPIAMENLSITQFLDILRYARIYSGVYPPQLWRFFKGNYVYLQCEASTNLDVKEGCTILLVKDFSQVAVGLLGE